MPLQSVRLWRAIKGKWRRRLAARMTKPVTTEGLHDSPHLFWSPWKQGQERSGSQEPRIDRYKRGERKTCVLLLAYHRLWSRCFQPPRNQSVVCTLQIQNMTFSVHTWCLLSFLQAYSRNKKICQTQLRLAYLTTFGLCCQSFFNPF